MQQIIYTENAAAEVEQLIASAAPDKVVILADETTHRLCLPRLAEAPSMAGAGRIVIPPGDTHKTLPTLAKVWQGLEQEGATRGSLLVNLGGGMVTDLGGFAAATFKRGIRFINVPTTLLAMVDAAVGGKTGINFGGLKNEVGAFREADAVVVCTPFLSTLDGANLCSGYAEMLKHALLSSRALWARHLRFPLDAPDPRLLQELVRESIALKQRIVAADPTEQGLRKALNLGHTAGHAFESLLLQEHRPVLHGYAVAWGLVAELCLSAVREGLPTDVLRATAAFVRETYGHFPFTCRHYEALFALMQHDKKNTAGHINFTLLADVGDIRLDCHATKQEVFEAFDFLREGV
ncbi:MAG: 3-dehydroquinate synthase [Alloprevotella sp.]